MDNLGSTAFVLTFLLGGTILIGLFVMLILLKTKVLGISRWFLIALIFFLIFHLDTFLLFTTEIIKQHPDLLGLSYPSLFLLGPSFLLFIKSYNVKTFRLKPIDVLHALPFLIALTEQINFTLQTREYKIRVITYYYDHVPDGVVTFDAWLSTNIFVILFLTYLVISLYLVKSKHNGNKTTLKRITWTLILLCIAFMLVHTGFLITGISAVTTEIVLASLMAIAILFLSYSVVDIKELFARTKNKYETSPLNTFEQELIKEKLIHALAIEKLFLKQNLKISNLSQATDIPSHHISQVLSEQMNISYYDFVNSYRVEAVKQQFMRGMASKLSIQAIGEECGFSNKTSFYRAFKKFTNETPNSYFNKILKQSQQ